MLFRCFPLDFRAKERDNEAMTRKGYKGVFLGTIGETNFTELMLWRIQNAIGQILPRDKGKQVYLDKSLIMVENDEQRDKRVQQGKP